MVPGSIPVGFGTVTPPYFQVSLADALVMDEDDLDAALDALNEAQREWVDSIKARR